MSFLLKSVEVANIRRHEGFVFEPAASGVTAISGPNGAGKSSVLDALGWCLYGVRPPGVTRAGDLVRDGVKTGRDGDPVFVRVRLWVDGVLYMVERRLVGSKASAECDVWVVDEGVVLPDGLNVLSDVGRPVSGFVLGEGNDQSVLDGACAQVFGDDGSCAGVSGYKDLLRSDSDCIVDGYYWVHKVGSSVTDAQVFINKVTSLTDKGFEAAVMVQQKQVDDLVSSTGASRRDTMERLTGVKPIALALADAKNSTRDAKRDLKAFDLDLSVVKQNLRDKRQVDSDLAGVRKKYDKVLVDHGKVEGEFSDVSKVIEVEDERRVRARDGETRLGFAEKILGQIESDLEGAVARKDELRGKYNAVAGMASLDEVEKLRSGAEQGRNRAIDGLGRVNSFVSHVVDNVISAGLNRLGLLNFVRQDASLGELANIFSGERDRVMGFATADSGNPVKQFDLNVESDWDVFRVSDGTSGRVASIMGGVRGEFDSAVKYVGQMEVLQADLSSKVEPLRVERTKLSGEMFSLDEALSAIGGSDGGECPTCLQKVESREHVLDVIADRKNSVESKLKEIDGQIAGLEDELEAAKANEGRAREIAGVLDSVLGLDGLLEKEFEGLAGHAKSLAENLVELDRVGGVLNDIRRAHDIKQDYDDARKHVEGLLSRQQSEISTINSIREELKSLDLMSDSKYGRLVEKKAGLEEKLSESGSMLQDLKVEVAKLSERAEYLQKIVEGDEKKVAKHEELSAVASQAKSTEEFLKDFQEEHLSNTIPAVESYASQYLQEFTNGDFVELRLDRTSYATTVVTKDGTERPANLLSGGELSAVAIALRLAISSMLGANLITLDEVLVSQDEERANAILNAIKSRAHGQVIMIAHNGFSDSFTDLVVPIGR